MLDGLAEVDLAAGRPPARGRSTTTADRHVVRTVRHGQADVDRSSGRPAIKALQRAGRRSWRVPVTAFWQAHRDAADVYSSLVADWAQPGTVGMTPWDLYGGAGVFAAVLGDAVGESGRVVTVDTSRAASRAARDALADLPQVHVVTDSVRRALAAQRPPPYKPMWRYWIHRDQAPGAMLSACWPPPRFRGWCTSVARQLLSPRHRPLSQSWLCRRGD